MLDRLFEGHDLSTVHTLMALLGAGLALYVMQLTSHEHEDAADPAWLRWSRRLSLGGVAMSFLWSLSYSMTKQWQPWPPEVALHLALIGMLSVRAAAIHARIWRERNRQMVRVPSRGTP